MNHRALLAAPAIGAVVALASACGGTAPVDGNPIRHTPGQWAAVVIEDHTDSAWPVRGSVAVWGIQNAVFGSCASQPARVCYVIGQGQTTTNGGWTSWSYIPGAGKIKCRTTLDPDARGKSAAIRQELVVHELGHCYGLAHAAQGSGAMEPTVTGRYAVPTGNERDTMRRLYVG